MTESVNRPERAPPPSTRAKITTAATSQKKARALDHAKNCSSKNRFLLPIRDNDHQSFMFFIIIVIVIVIIVIIVIAA